MIKDIKVCKMIEKDVNEAKEIWMNQYNLYCNNIKFPSYWKEKSELLENFLNWKIKNENAIVAKLNDKVIGFLAYDEFPFNGEKSTFCPAIAHSAVEEYKESVYLEMYKNVSQKWVNRNIFNHMWTIFYNDEKLKNILFDLGYGSYLIDAFNDVNISNIIYEKSGYKIKKATIEDVDILYDLVKESNRYYASAPLFLKRDELNKNEIEEIIVKNNVLIVWDKEIAIGFVNLTIADENNFIDMSIINCALIDEIGIYIKLEYRNKKIGIELLREIINYCKEHKVEYIHVDFETANLYGNKFWRKYFTPMLLSMRRTINKDINDI